MGYTLYLQTKVTPRRMIYRHLKLPVTRLLVQQVDQAKNKENIDVLHNWFFVKGIHSWAVDPSTKSQ